jgi:hypothetical protein
MKNIVREMSEKKLLPVIFAERPQLLVAALLIYNYIVTLVPSLFLIYFFTRPKVKRLFIDGTGQVSSQSD